MAFPLQRFVGLGMWQMPYICHWKTEIALFSMLSRWKRLFCWEQMVLFFQIRTWAVVNDDDNCLTIFCSDNNLFFSRDCVESFSQLNRLVQLYGFPQPWHRFSKTLDDIFRDFTSRKNKFRSIKIAEIRFVPSYKYSYNIQPVFM